MCKESEGYAASGEYTHGVNRVVVFFTLPLMLLTLLLASSSLPLRLSRRCPAEVETAAAVVVLNKISNKLFLD